MQLSRYFLPMLKEERGVIIFISSICGIESLDAPVDYSVAKSALISFAKNLSRKIAPAVRVNVVAPGNVYFKGGTWDKKLRSDKIEVENMIDLPKGVVLRHAAFKGNPWDEYWKLPWKVFFLVTVPS